MPNPHVYGHHQYPQADSGWMHQQTSHQHHAQAAAAAATVAQQQHYNRLASAHNTVGALAQQSHAQDNALESSVSEDNRRTLQYIADLLNENTREGALLELSKKREQVPELALILWHSFGTTWLPPVAATRGPAVSHIMCPLTRIISRCHDIAASRDHQRVQPTQPLAAHRSCLQQSV